MARPEQRPPGPSEHETMIFYGGSGDSSVATRPRPPVPPPPPGAGLAAKGHMPHRHHPKQGHTGGRRTQPGATRSGPRGPGSNEKEAGFGSNGRWRDVIQGLGLGPEGREAGGERRKGSGRTGLGLAALAAAAASLGRPGARSLWRRMGGRLRATWEGDAGGRGGSMKIEY